MQSKIFVHVDRQCMSCRSELCLALQAFCSLELGSIENGDALWEKWTCNSN